MTVSQLKDIFEKNGVPSNYYSFDSRFGSDTYVLEHQSSGWLLFYTERGSNFEEQRFNNEDAACRAMFVKVQDMVKAGQHRTISMDV